RARRPATALASGVHHEQRVAEGGQRQMRGRQVAAAAVADELDHDRRRVIAIEAGPDIPGADPVAVRAGELDVVHLERRVERRLVRGQLRRPRSGAGRREPVRPPGVEPRRLLRRDAVLGQFLDGQIKPRHSAHLTGARGRVLPPGARHLWWNAGMAERVGPGQLARLLRMPEPTPEQAAVICAPLGPLAVIAGAGSGKSETMAARLVWLVANGMVRPDRVLGLTF